MIKGLMTRDLLMIIHGGKTVLPKRKGFVPNLKKVSREEAPPPQKKKKKKDNCPMSESLFKMVQERDPQFYKCLVEGVDLRSIAAWLMDIREDPGFDRMRSWAGAELK